MSLFFFSPQNQTNISRLGKWGGLAYILLFGGVCLLVFSPLTKILTKFLFENPQSADSLKFSNAILQIFITATTVLGVGFFICKNRPLHYLPLKKSIYPRDFFMILIFAFLSLPFVNFVADWNQSLHLPTLFSNLETWIRETESQLAATTELLLQGKTFNILIINLLAIALIPALCEEFFFRGLLQQWAVFALGNKIVGVLFTAFIFSAIHLQFLGFFPRFLLGIYLGYLTIKSGTLWSAVLAHFINNAIIVVAAFLYHNHIICIDYHTVGNFSNNITIIIASAFLSFLLLFWYHKRYKFPPKFPHRDF
ncbi:MAG: CPBP family intramembrane metalloprotease [Bacteroidales bacterium]|jgi:membrane protease YdiL (CAAX protease family)|nr:CPBP family intramembrane metalloprotease [Bacteroidales bacterium]